MLVPRPAFELTPSASLRFLIHFTQGPSPLGDSPRRRLPLDRLGTASFASIVAGQPLGVLLPPQMYATKAPVDGPPPVAEYYNHHPPPNRSRFVPYRFCRTGRRVHHESCRLLTLLG